MIKKKAYLIFCALSILLVIAFPKAFACSCAGKSTVLEEFERADLVIVARALSVKKTEDNYPNKMRAIYGVESTVMVVENVYKGDIGIGDQLTFSQGGGGDCIFTFKEEDIGKQYLFYLNKPPQNYSRYVAVECGRSNDLEYAADDLLYLNNLAKVRGKTRISGTLFSWTWDKPDVSGKKIKVIGKEKTWETATDKHGVYEIYDLPAGEYWVEPEMPKGFKIDNTYVQLFGASFSGNRNDRINGSIDRIPIMLEAKRHAGLDILVTIDNFIRGKLLSPNGSPMEGICLDALRINDNKNVLKFGCTDKSGNFEIREIQSGDYLLVANPAGHVTSKEPFETLYYPGVADKKKATVFSMGPGIYIENADMQIPKLEERITISGNLIYSDGKPTSNVTVIVQYKPNLPEMASKDPITITSDNSKFHLDILKGLDGVLYGTIFVFRGEFKDCPQIEQIIAENEKRQIHELRTDEVRIWGTDSISDVSLSFPIPYCEKAQIP